MFNDLKYLQIAIKQAQIALQNGEMPVGAVFVVKNYPQRGDVFITKAYNKTSKNNNNSSHAEILAINKMCKKLNTNNFYGIDATIFTTLEPCLMCYGFIGLNKIQNLIFGLKNEKFGFLANAKNTSQYNVNYLHGFYEKEIKSLMSDFFAKSRNLKPIK